MNYQFFLDLMKRNEQYPVYSQIRFDLFTLFMGIPRIVRSFAPEVVRSLSVTSEPTNGLIQLTDEKNTVRIQVFRLLTIPFFASKHDEVLVTIEVFVSGEWELVCKSKGKLSDPFVDLDKFPELKAFIQNSYASINEETSKLAKQLAMKRNHERVKERTEQEKIKEEKINQMFS